MSLVVLLITSIVGYFAVYSPWHARLNGIQTQGTVTNTNVCDTSSDSGGDSVIRPFLAQDSSNSVTADIEFIDLHGQKQDVYESTCGDYTQGQAVTLWYLPNDPQTFTTDQQLSGTYILGAILGLVSLPSVATLLMMLARALFFVPLLLLASARRARQPQPAYASSAYQPQSFSPLGYQAPLAYSPYSPASASPQLAPPTTSMAYRVGQTAEIDNLCAVTLTRVTTSPGEAGSLAAPGQVYLLIRAALRNRSSQPLDAFSAGRFQLADTQGNEYQPALLPGTVFYLTETIQPGSQQEEQLAFSVPVTIHEFRLTFQRDRSSPPLATWEISI
jgi:hypothetical protein